MLQIILCAIAIFGSGCWVGCMAEEHDSFEMISLVSMCLAIASAFILIGMHLA